MAKVRKNVVLAEEMANFVEKQAEAFGISQSGFINICIKHYNDQMVVVKEMSKMQDYMQKLEELLENSKTIDK